MKLSKIVIIFFVLLLAVSTASAGYYHGSNQRHHGYSQERTTHSWKSCQDCRTGYSPCTSSRQCNTQNRTSRCSPRGCNSSCVNVPVEGNDTEVVVPPVVPSGDSGTTIVKLCSGNSCTVGGNGRTLELVNYNNAVDPTYDQLITFLRADKTDEKPYTSTYVCSDFAKTLHDNAEKAGIRAGWQGVRTCNHAFNLFQTTDKGLVYIDCTGQPGGSTLEDKQLDFVVGKPLTGKYLFRSGSVNMGCNSGEPLVYW